MTPLSTYNIALDCIDKHAQSLHNKHKTALICVHGSLGANGRSPVRLTFSHLEGLTNRFANALLSLGLSVGDRVLIRLPNRPEFPVTFLGAIKAELIPIPHSPLNTWTELKFLLEDSEASALVTTLDLVPAELLQEKPPSLKKIILLSPKDKTLPEGTHRWEDLLKNASSSFQTKPTPADSPAFWLYTSGTEGKPKAVIHAHRSVRAHDGRAKLWQDLRSNDVIFNTSSLNWSYALTCGLLDVWRHGLPTLISSGDLKAETICHLVKHFGVTTFMSVPGIYRRLVEYLETEQVGAATQGRPTVAGTHTGAPLQNVRVCLSAGEKLSGEIRDRFRTQTGLEIYEGLGMTEHSVYLIQHFGEPIVAGSCGKPVPDSRITILRDDLSEASPGETGHLASHRSCPGLMLGYHTNPPNPPFSKGGNQNVSPPLKKGGEGGFSGDWFLSGDLAYRDEAGNFFFQGRSDDMITAGGYRISPLEVEEALNQHPLVSESAAVGQEREKGKTLLVAYVVLRTSVEGNTETKKEIMHFAEKYLAKYKLPREILFVKSLPKTSNGKIKRKELNGAKE